MCIRELQLELQKVTVKVTAIVTDRIQLQTELHLQCNREVIPSHWIPQCGPGNKAADGALYASHTPCPSRLQQLWTSHPTMTKSGESPPYEKSMALPSDKFHDTTY